MIALLSRREHYCCQIRFKFGPGETKIGSNRSPEGVLGVLGGPQAPQENQADPWEAAWESPGRSKWEPRSPKTPQNLRKWSQNGVKIGSKTGPKWDQIRSAQKCRFLIDFGSIFYQKNMFDFDRFCNDLVLGLTSSEKWNLHETLSKPKRNQLF